MTNQFHPVGAPSGQKENSHFIAIVAAPKDNVDDGREGEFTVCNVNDAWQELDDETFQLYPGGARNYYYRSEGRVMNHRSLNVAASLDQTRLSISDIQPSHISRRHEHLYQAPSCPGAFSYAKKRADMAGSNAIHVPLPSANFTRFLELMPGNGDRIECRLHCSHIPTSEFSYEAISYSSNSQGSESNFPGCRDHRHAPARDSSTESVLCNEYEVYTSRVLVEALRRLRLPDESRLLWAAGLCVNASDVSDRNHHTRIATSIFQHASRVIVWLGRQWTTADEMAFPSVCRIVNRWRTSSGLTYQIPAAEYSPETSQFRQCVRLEKHTQPSSTKDAWLSVVELFQNRWFSSAWSLKETAAASCISLMLGNQEISWDWIGLAAAILRENYGRVSCIPQSKWERGKRAFPGPGILQAYFLYRVSQSQRFFLPLDLTYHELLSLTREFGCKYKHDKIYTTCGIPTLDSISSAIVPDYSKAVHTVYQEIALLFIQTNHSVAFLADVRNPHGWYHMKPGMTSKAPLELQGPSWVPRWHYQLTEKIAPLQNCFAFSAATKVRPKLQVSNDGSKIAILGVIVDTVKSAIENRSVGTYWRGEEVRDSFFSRSKQTLDELLHINKLKPNQLLPLALTLTCGKNWDGAPVSDMEMHVADYARCLLRGGLLWSLACASKPFAMGQDDSAAQQNLHTGDVITAQALEVMSRGGNADRFLDAAATMGDGRAHFLTTGNQFGIGPDSTYPGDILCVLYGLGVPCIIRPRAETGCYILLGECYVEEIMHGEVITSLASNSGGVLKESWIQLE